MDKENKISLFECTSLFAETMHERFPNGCLDDSAIFLIATDGSKLSSLIDGNDDILRSLIANVAVRDKEVRNMIGDGLIAAMQYEGQDSHGS